MICQFCGIEFQSLNIGEYVRHLIREHWKLLVKVHDAMEKENCKSVSDSAV